MTETIEGYDKLMKKLNMLENPHKPVRKGMMDYRTHLRKKIVPYPPHTQANVRPGINGYSWYDRGYGTRTITGKAYPTSEDIKKRWEFSVKKLSSVIRLTVKNFASYSIYVQGERQRHYHANRGWRRVDKVIDVSLQVLVRFIGKEIDRELNK